MKRAEKSVVFAWVVILGFVSLFWYAVISFSIVSCIKTWNTAMTRIDSASTYEMCVTLVAFFLLTKVVELQLKLKGIIKD